MPFIFSIVNYCLKINETLEMTYIEITSHVLINHAVGVESITEGASLSLQVRKMPQIMLF